MFVIHIVEDEKIYYAQRNDGYWYRWYEGETNKPEFWDIVPWCGY